MQIELMYGVNLKDTEAIKIPWDHKDFTDPISNSTSFEYWCLTLFKYKKEDQKLINDLRLNKMSAYIQLMDERKEFLNKINFRVNVCYPDYHNCFLYLKETHIETSCLIDANTNLFKSVDIEKDNYLNMFIDEYINPVNNIDVKTLPKQYLIFPNEGNY